MDAVHNYGASQLGSYCHLLPEELRLFPILHLAGIRGCPLPGAANKGRGDCWRDEGGGRGSQGCREWSEMDNTREGRRREWEG